MHITYLTLLTLLAAIYPNAPRSGYAVAHAKAIVFVASTDEPVPGFTRDESAALLAVTAYEEGRLGMVVARGDGGASCSTYQIMARTKEQCESLERDPIYAARYALFVMRLSAKYCPSSQLAPYCGSCASKRAREISDSRIANARRLAANASH